MDRSLPVILAASSVAAAAWAVNQLLKTLLRARAGARPALWAPPPHPGWRPPQPQPAPFSGASIPVDPANLPGDQLYPLVISAVVPRPVAFVSTLGSTGAGNLAPFSYFNVVAHNPPHVVIGFATSRERSHGRKDTLFNILDTKEFVVNIISEWFVEAANHTCGNFAYGEDEMVLSGLTPVPSTKVRPPRVKESAVNMECVLRQTYEIKDRQRKVTGTVILGEVVMMHIHEGVAGRSPSGKLVVDPNKLAPISRMGGNTYARTSGMFDLPRPDRAV